MAKMKIVDIMLTAVSAMIAAAKSVFKFIENIIKLRPQPSEG